eukprot:COSAG01_NODE_2991_length_6744_cov_251.630248_1_plen_95_part_00
MAWRTQDSPGRACPGEQASWRTDSRDSPAFRGADELGECCMCPSLSISQRFTGTLVCLGVTALWFTLAIVTLSTGQLSLFGIYYTCGNVSAVSR